MALSKMSSTEEPMSPVRRIIADRMTQGWQIPKVVETILTSTEAMSARMRAMREEAEGAPKYTLADALIYHLARGLRAYPKLNSTMADGKIICFDDVNIGFAVNLEAGLFVPVVRNADRLSLREICEKRIELVARLRAGDMSSEVLGGGTFTISNLGGSNVDFFAPIINPPQCAILGVGREKARPMVVDGQVCAKLTTYLSIVFDHRIVDGAMPAEFLSELSQNIENCEF